MQIGQPKRVYKVEPLRAPASTDPKELPRRAKPAPQLKPAAVR